MAHRPDPPHGPSRSTRCAPSLALFDQTIFTTLPAIYREMDRRIDRRRLRRATAVVRTVPPLGHLGRRRSRREPAGDGGGDPCGDGYPIRSRVARDLEAASRRIARTLSVSERDVPPSRALRRALERDADALPGRRPRARTNSVGRAASAQARALGRTGWPHTRTGAKGGYDGPAAFLSDLDVLQRSLDAGGRSPPGVGRAPTPALAGRDVRLPPGVHGGPAALERAGCGARGTRVLAIDPAFGGDPRGDRHVPRDRRHPVATGDGSVRARGRELHPFRGRSRRRVVARPYRRSGSAARCHTGAAARIPEGAHHRRGDPGRLAVDARRGAASRSDAAARWR